MRFNPKNGVKWKKIQIYLFFSAQRGVFLEKVKILNSEKPRPVWPKTKVIFVFQACTTCHPVCPPGLSVRQVLYVCLSLSMDLNIQYNRSIYSHYITLIDCAKKKEKVPNFEKRKTLLPLK